MDLAIVLKPFDGSLFPDEYRGDFQEYRQRTHNAEEPDVLATDKLAEKCLIHGVYEMLRGCHGRDGGDALFTSSELASRPDVNPKWWSRLKAYARLNLIFRLSPPVIRFRSNLGGSASTILECELGVRKSQLAPLPAYATSAADLSEMMTVSWLNSFYIGGWMSASSHPQFAHPGLKAAAKMNSSQVQSLPTSVADDLAKEGFDTLSAYFRRLEWEAALNRKQLDDVEGAFGALRDHYLRARDVVGLATVHLLIGDRYLSPPFTSPLALNLIVEGHLLGWQNEEWDKAEPEFGLVRNISAENHYTTALDLVQGLKAPRLKGAVYLRRACVLHITGLHCMIRGELPESENLLNEAASVLNEASGQFVLDHSHSQMVQCHQLLLHITRGDASNLPEQATQLGAAGRSSGNTALGQFFGLLMLRFGRRLFLDHARVDLAQLCCECAKKCFKALDDKVYLMQASLAEAQLKYLSGDFVGAQALIDAIRRESGALEYLREVSLGSPENAEAMGMVIVNLLTGYNRIVSAIYSSANDASAVRSWREEYRQLNVRFNLQTILAAQGPLAALNNATTGAQTPIDVNRLVEETDDASTISDLYNHYINLGYAALANADVDGETGFNACLRSFLQELATLRGPEDIALTFQIIAHAALGELPMAQDLLPRAITKTFSGSADDSLVASELRVVHFEGVAMSNEFKIDFNAADRAISLCYVARAWDQGRKVLLQVARVFPELLGANGPGAKLDGSDWKFAVYVACIWEHIGEMQKALPWYLWAFQALQTQRSHVEDPEARRGMQWSIYTAELFAGLIRVSLCLWCSTCKNTVGDQILQPHEAGLTASTWLEQALLFMEHSFARTLLELIVAHNDTESATDLEVWASKSFLERQVADLRSVEHQQTSKVAAREREYRNAISTTTAAAAAAVAGGGVDWETQKTGEARLKRQVEGERRALKALQKKISGHADELSKLEKKFPERDLSTTLRAASKALLSSTQFRINPKSIFADAVPANALVIELHTSRSGLIIFAITREGIQVTETTPISDVELRKLAFPYIKTLRDQGEPRQNRPAGSGDDGVLDVALDSDHPDIVTRLKELSRLILGPVERLLDHNDGGGGGGAGLDHLIFVPSSILMTFPFGCLLYQDRPVILAKAVSQAPSLAVLQRLRQQHHSTSLLPSPPQAQQQSTTTKRPRRIFSIVHTHESKASGLPMIRSVGLGAMSISRLFDPKQPPLRAEEVDEAQFAREYKQAEMVHVGTHGFQTALAPWQSYLALKTQLKVMELTKMRTEATLVVFCACLSGLGRATNGNDVLGFSHAVLQSGAQAYMGALWKVSELDTMVLLVLFYRRLAATTPTSIAQAWQAAQVAFYHLDRAGMTQIFEDVADDWAQMEKDGVDTDAFMKGGKEWLLETVAKINWEQQVKNFKNPYYWASFTLVGNADVCLSSMY